MLTFYRIVRASFATLGSIALGLTILFAIAACNDSQRYKERPDLVKCAFNSGGAVVFGFASAAFGVAAYLAHRKTASIKHVA